MSAADLCSSCGSRPAVSGDLCGACESAQQWLGNAHVGATSKQLDRARADLIALPDLVVELSRCLTEKPQQQGGGGGKPGSRPPMRLDVLHLVDEREKPLWWGEDPRVEDMGDRYGVLWQLAAWTRVLAEEMPDAPYLADSPTVISEVQYLLAAWDWIAVQQWSDEFCSDVSGLASQVKSGLGIRREYRPRCRYCRDSVEPVDTSHTVTNWEACSYGLCQGCGHQYPPGPELAALAKVQRSVPLESISDDLGIPLPTLYRWLNAGVFAPAPDSPKRTSNRKPALFDLATVREKTTLLRSA